MSFVIMGVSGCGKSSLGIYLSESLNLPFHDGDDYHPKTNVDKMAGGNPLNDQDRKPWLEILGGVLSENVIVACSALKMSYRDILRTFATTKITFIYLKGSYDYYLKRMESRDAHYMKSGMLKSQFDALEEPPIDGEENVIVVDVKGKSVVEIGECLKAEM